MIMSEFKKWVISEPYIDIQGTLLEGPCYDESRNEFRFVDIWDNKIHLVDLNKGPESLRSIDMATSVSVTANIADDNANADTYKDQILVGAKYGYALAHRQTGELSYLCKVWEGEQGGTEKAETMRFNDGAIDSHGRFWAGAMNDQKVKKPTQEGVLFRLDPDLTLHRMLDQLTIPNGIGWNDSDDTMYVTDSPTGRIYAFDFDASTGSISNRRVHFQVDGEEPDGFAIDAEGCVWSAIYGGWRVVRIAPGPQGGKVIGEVYLPTRNVTCCTFVGTELFITTAKDDSDGDCNDKDGSGSGSGSGRYGGRVFRVDVGIGGQPKYKFRLRG